MRSELNARKTEKSSYSSRNLEDKNIEGVRDFETSGKYLQIEKVVDKFEA